MYRTDRIIEIYEENWDNLYRLCLIYMKNQEDACDVVQETFVRLLKHTGEGLCFESEAGERAWLRKVACNLCKSELRHWWRKKRQKIDAVSLLSEVGENTDKQAEVLEELLALPEKYRVLLYLHYYEGYSVEELGDILHENPSTLRSRIVRGRKLLGEKLKEDGYGK